MDPGGAYALSTEPCGLHRAGRLALVEVLMHLFWNAAAGLCPRPALLPLPVSGSHFLCWVLEEDE